MVVAEIKAPHILGSSHVQVRVADGHRGDREKSPSKVTFRFHNNYVLS